MGIGTVAPAASDWLMACWSVLARWLPAARKPAFAPQAPAFPPQAPVPMRISPAPTRPALTQPIREVATRSLGRAASEPLPTFIPEGGGELAQWLALPRDRQALLAAIASRLDAETQAHLRVLLSRGTLAAQDPAGGGDLLSRLANLLSTQTDSSVARLIAGLAAPEPPAGLRQLD